MEASMTWLRCERADSVAEKIDTNVKKDLEMLIFLLYYTI